MSRPRSGDSSQYKEVRGLARGLSLLRALNGMAGGSGAVVELARATGIHRTTVKRLLETLRTEGFVDQKDDRALYTLTFEVRRLAEGYVASDWIERVAAPAMRSHLRSLSWPSDLATPDAGFMIVRESTHRQSLLSQHRATIGFRIPMLVSSLGRAWLSYCTDEEREGTLSILRTRADDIGETARDARYIERILTDTRRRGYGINDGEWLSEANVTAIAFPIRRGEHAIAAINLVLVRDAVPMREIKSRYVPLLKTLADRVSYGIGLQSG